MAEKGTRKEDKNGEVEIDFGIGQVSFGGLFKGLGNLIDLATRLKETEGHREVNLPGGRKGVYGFSIRTLAGKPVIESFGNIRDTARGPTVQEVREPMVDVFDEKDHVLVVAELPGVSADQVKVEVSGDILNLTAGDSDRKYAREILLPCKVNPKPLKTAYKNGILEITLGKEQ